MKIPLLSVSLSDKRPKLAALTLMVLIAVSGRLQAQQEINVNPAKGLMSVDIPLYTFNIPGFSLPIGITYAARGYRPGSMYKPYTGWEMLGPGTIKRILRSLPDEEDDTYRSRKGWMFSGLYGVPSTFSPADNNDDSNCADDEANMNWLNSNGDYQRDLEPDIYVVQAPGLNCRIMMDNQGVFRALPAQDIKIEFNVLAWNDKDFVITTNNGVKYTFSLNSIANRQVVNSINTYDLFRTDPNYYSYGMGFADTWYLTKIEVQSEGKYSYLTYNYSNPVSFTNNEDMKVYIKDNAADTARENTLYSWYKSSANRRYITSIVSSAGEKVVFNGDSEYPTGFAIYNGLEAGRPVDRVIELQSYQAFDGTGHTKDYLMTIAESGGECSRILYKFSYYGKLEYGEAGVNGFPVDPESKKTDAWGYLNGSAGDHPAPKIYVYPALKSTTGIYRPYPIPGYTGTYYTLPGNDKTANENTIAYGSLSKITYPSGGSSSFEYECNSFLDQDANAEVKGGGMRIKAINHFDGINTATISRKEFIYKNDLGTTSGTINMLPAYAISTSSYKDLISNITKSYSDILNTYTENSVDYWNYLTVRTLQDMYMGESTVSYTQVTTKETGNGKIKQVFSPSKSFWDLNTSVLSYPAKSCVSGNSTFIAKGYNQYPFAPFAHLEGGELLAEYTYNENGYLLKKKELQYEDYYASPQKIYGIARDNNFGIRQFSKYGLDINGKLLTQVKETVYDNNLTGNGITTQIDYDNSAFNRKVKSSIQTNSDNTQIKTSYLYCGDFDFDAQDVNTPAIWGLYELKARNLRDVVLEQRTEIKPAGALGFKTIASKAVLYNVDGSGANALPVLKETLSLKSQSGLTDFSPMQQTGSIPNRAITTDARYKTEKVFSDYSAVHLPGAVSEKRLSTAMVNDSLLRMPMLQISGAGIEDIGFDNFDRMDNNATTYFYGAYWANYFDDPYFGRYVRFIPSMELYKNLTRKAENKFYKIAFIARTDTATQVNILINDVAVSTITIPISSQFKFYEKVIDLSAFSSACRIKMTTNGNFYLDNFTLYPADAQFTAANYQIGTGKTMEIMSNGVAKLYQYDANKRPAAERDLSGNITKAKFYNTPNNMIYNAMYSYITVLNEDKNFAGRVMKFNALRTCTPGVKYVWDFGDGHTLESFDTNVEHVYAAADTYTVTLTVQHPEYSSASSTHNLAIQAEPVVTASVCVSGITRMNACNNAIKYYNSCGSYPPGNMDSPNGTKFYISASGCPGNVYTYQWEISYNGVEYEAVGPGATDPVLQMSMYDFGEDFWIRCRVTAGSCDTVISTSPVFIEYNCDVN